MGPAVEAAQVCRDFLVNRLGKDYEWLQQVQDGIEVYLHRCLTQFSGSQPQNGSAISSGADYVMPARTAEEIKATVAAEQGAVTAAKRGFKLTDSAEKITKREGLADPAAQFDENLGSSPPQRPAPTPPPQAKKPEGWVI